MQKIKDTVNGAIGVSCLIVTALIIESYECLWWIKNDGWVKFMEDRQ